MGNANNQKRPRQGRTARINMAAAEIPAIPPPVIETVADVRKMVICIYCGKAGVRHAGLLRADAAGSYAHPKCFVRERGALTFFALDIDELEHVRICDVGVSFMREVMHSLEVRRGNR